MSEEDELEATREWIKAPDVVSEIHTFLVTTSDISPIVKSTNRIAKLSFSLPSSLQSSAQKGQAQGPSQSQSDNKLQFDKDGDAVIPNRLTRRTQVGESSESGLQGQDDYLFIEYENSSTLELVGLQIWRGALILADFILYNESLFRNKIILELGSGTGLSSVCASFFASKVIATDLDQPDILNLIRANKNHNQNFIRASFQVTALDFTNTEWSQELEQQIHETDIILAADVVYHNKITDAFIRTLEKCLTTGKPKNVFIALEKRYVFTASDLDVAAPMYEYFMDLLQSSSLLLSASPKYNLIQVPTDFPQYFNYERTKELVLWHIQPKEV